MALRIGRRSATRSADRPRLVWAIVAIALVAALAAAAALVGSRLIKHPPTGGVLAYALNDDIYLADQDGTHPRKVADGVPWTNGAGGGPSYLFGDGGPIWAPDGRHFLFFDLQGPSGQGTAHIADADGHMVASFPGMWVDATWSPDSARLEAWTGGSEWIGTTSIGIYGIDGVLQTSLALPDGYVRSRESGGVWAPDGRSVYVRLGQGLGPPLGIWQLPLDGSAPRRIADDDLIARARGDVTISPDGRRIAASVGGTLFVANADGTDPRAVVPAGASGPIWSPIGTQVAYVVGSADGVTDDIRVVDVASGTDRTVVAGLKVNGPGLLGWSPAGDLILFAGLDQQGSSSSLWSINADGTGRKLLAAGAEGGGWQVIP
jgi:Tol biopolymer transport system component